MTTHVHISQGEIEKAVAEIRRRIREGGDGTPEDAAYARLGEPLVERFVRWQIAEINAGTDSQIMGMAVLRLCGWMVGQGCAGLPTEAERAAAVRSMVQVVMLNALAFATPGVDERDILVPTEKGGRA